MSALDRIGAALNGALDAVSERLRHAEERQQFIDRHVIPPGQERRYQSAARLRQTRERER